MAEKTMSWSFREVAEGEKHRNPPHDYLFQPSEGDSTEPLVREVVQNSMDAQSDSARNSSKPVELVFRLTRIPHFKQAGMESLEPHLLADANGLDNTLVKETLVKDEIDALIIEDFNTTGLLGPVDSSAPTDEDKSGYGYFYFAHAEGESGKGSEDQGSWGLGKQVLPQASVLNTFFAWTIRDTVRNNDPKQLLFGQCIVKYHTTDGKTYAPDGFFGVPEELTTPITDSSHITRFTQTIPFHRSNEPGLSVLIPGLRDGYEGNKIIETLVSNYYYSFFKGKLTATIIDDTESTEPVVINQETLSALAEKYFPKEKNKSFYALRQIFQARSEPERVTRLEMKPITYGDYKVGLSELIDDVDLEKAAETWEAGGIVHLPVLMEVRAQGDKDFKAGKADLYVIKQQDLGRSKPVFYRDGLHISDMRVRYQHRDLLAVMFTNSGHDNPLGLLLRESENPAHTEWMRTSPKARNSFYRANEVVGRIRVIPAEFPQAVKAIQSTENRSILASIFPRPLVGSNLKAPSASKKERKPTVKTKESEKFDVTLPPPRPKPYNLVKLENGFRVGKVEGTEDSFPRILTVTVAYDMIGGDPFKNYTKFDFDFTKNDEIRIDSCGDLEQLGVKENSVQFLLRSPDFDIKFRGFDIHRDIKVKATSRKAEQQEIIL